MPGDLAVIIPAFNEAERVGATVQAAASLPGADLVVVVDDGSADDTAAVAERAGAHVVRHARNRGKAAALETGAEAVRLLESAAPNGAAAGSEVGAAGAAPRYLLFLDADLGETAAQAAAGRAGPARDSRHDDRRVL